MRLRLLDAAHEQSSRMGIRRSTMEGVARQVGISRITAYRRFATKDALIERVSSLQAIRRNPPFGGLMATELEMLIPP